MAFSVEHARQMYASRGPVGFVRSMQTLLGLRNAKGIRYRNAEGRPVLESQQISPDVMSIKGLAVAIFGSEDRIAAGLDRAAGAPAIGELHGDVMEAGNEIVPSGFADITAYNETVAGLLEVKILEAYNRPEFLAPQLATTIPSNKVQEKFIGISTPADAAQSRQPGQSHPRANLSERYVTTPITKNRANAIDITREAVMFDLTRQLLDHAELVSQTLALRKEYLMLDVILGISNDYTYDGTSYYTYVPSSGYWANLVANDLVDWTALDYDYTLFSRMTDQETGQPISVDARDILVMPGRYNLARKILGDTQVRQGGLIGEYTGAAKAHAVVAADTGQPLGYGANPISGQWNPPMVSQYAYKRVIDYPSDSVKAGLLYLMYTQNNSTWPYVTTGAINAAGYAAANAFWFAGNFKKAFVYVENLPLTITRAAPTSYEMADRGLVFSLFCDEMGIPAVKEPRYVIRNQSGTATVANWSNP